MSTSGRKRRKKAQEERNPSSAAPSATAASAAGAAGRCVNVSARYEKVGRLGEGTYGVVYKAKDKVSGDFVALKRCIPHHQASDGFPITALREIQSLRILCGGGRRGGHPNVVRLETVATSNSGVFLVFEYCQHDLGNLVDDHYKKRKQSPFSEREVKTLMSQLLGALDFIHSNHLIHRDIKLSNLLYATTDNGEGVLKVADFGLSRPYADSRRMFWTPAVASLWYRAPELLLGSGGRYTQSIDNWAAGCVMAELLKGFPLANGANEIDQIHKIVGCIGLPDPSLPYLRGSNIALPEPPSSPGTLLDSFSYLSVHGLRLLTGLLDYDPDKRWTPAQALASSNWLSGHDDPPSPLPTFPSP